MWGSSSLPPLGTFAGLSPLSSGISALDLPVGEIAPGQEASSSFVYFQLALCDLAVRSGDITVAESTVTSNERDSPASTCFTTQGHAQLSVLSFHFPTWSVLGFGQHLPHFTGPHTCSTHTPGLQFLSKHLLHTLKLFRTVGYRGSIFWGVSLHHRLHEGTLECTNYYHPLQAHKWDTQWGLCPLLHRWRH